MKKIVNRKDVETGYVESYVLYMIARGKKQCDFCSEQGIKYTWALINLYDYSSDEMEELFEVTARISDMLMSERDDMEYAMEEKGYRAKSWNLDIRKHSCCGLFENDRKNRIFLSMNEEIMCKAKQILKERWEH